MPTRPIPTDTSPHQRGKRQRRRRVIKCKETRDCEVEVDEDDYNTFNIICSASKRLGGRSFLTEDEGEKRICGLTLKHFDLSCGLPEEVERLSALTRFHALDSKIKAIPPFFFSLKNLVSIDLGGNHLKSLPKEIGDLVNLKRLDLRYNKFKKFPDAIGNLVQLLKLDLGDNLLTSIPEAIGNLVELVILDLGDNPLTSIPETIGNLVNLELLDLNNCCEISSLPSSIGNLKNLEILSLYHNNNLKSVPEEIGDLVNLRTLILEHTKISSLPSSIGKLKSLEKLNLETKHMKRLPKEFWDLSSLRKLNLAYAQVSIPPSIGRLQNLEELDLSYNNRLRDLPDEIGTLHKLKKLVLHREIRYQTCNFPSSMKNLQNLEHLDLTGLTNTVSFLEYLVNLKYLYIAGPSYSTFPYLRRMFDRRTMQKRVLGIAQTCPYLGEVDAHLEDGMPELTYTLACNRFKLRDPFRESIQMHRLANLWPQMLSKATRLFDRESNETRPFYLVINANREGNRDLIRFHVPYDWCYPPLIKPHDAIYKLLREGREFFLQAISDRNTRNGGKNNPTIVAADPSA